MKRKTALSFIPSPKIDVTPMLIKALFEKICEYTGFSADGIVCSSVTEELIFRIIRALKPRMTAVIGDRDDCVRALSANNCVFSVQSSPDDPLPEDTELVFIDVFSDRYKMGIAPEQLYSLSDKCSRAGARLGVIADRRYLPDEPFIPTGSSIILMSFPESCPQTAPKVSFAFCPDADTAAMLRQSAPENIVDSSVLYALAHTDIYTLSCNRERIIRERHYLTECLENLAITVSHSQTDRLRFTSPHISPAALRKRGIILPKPEDNAYIIQIQGMDSDHALVRAVTKELTQGLSWNFIEKYPYSGSGTDSTYNLIRSLPL